MNTDRLARFAEAWQRADVEALMSFVTDDCVYVTTTGPGPGTAYVGREDVRRGFADMLATDDGSIVAFATPQVFGDHGLIEWSQQAQDGKLLARGCDVFEFDGDRVRRKDAFRKVFG
jgi:ketosteroid isomerase-like protein